MAFKLPNAVQETTTTAGTGPLTLLGAVASRKAFSSQLSTGDTVAYVIEDGTDWEAGIGTFTAPSTLSRDTVIYSTNGNALFNWPGSGTRNVYVAAIGAMFAGLVDPSMVVGLLCKTADRTYAGRSIDVDTDDLQIANPAGTAGNPTLALAFTVTTFIKSLLATTTNAGARAAIGAERAFASTTLTFASVAAATDGTPQNWAHGLGTDDIDFGITVEHDNAAVSYTTKAAAAIGANGAWAMFGDGSGLPADPNVPANAPATGNIRVNVRNLAGSTSTIRVHIWARAR